MSAERLREAARVLRERASRTEAGPWQSRVACSGSLVAQVMGPAVTPIIRDGAAEYIATMHPGVGLALADWLDATADFHDDKPHGYDCQGCGAEPVADAILGGA